MNRKERNHKEPNHKEHKGHKEDQAFFFVIFVPFVVLFVVFSTAIVTRAVAAERARDRDASDPAYLVLDATTGNIVESKWDDASRPVPIGSLIKPFTALAYAGSHNRTYPTFVCRGTDDACWLPGGHGHVTMADAIAGSCNAYFYQLSRQTSPDALVSTLQWFGMPVDRAVATPAAMVGLGDGLKLSPVALARAYLELASRSGQREVMPIVRGMMASARTGTGKALGLAIGSADALVKTGTAPCAHSSRASGDGYAVVVYPAERPRVVLLVRAHGRTGAEAAGLAGKVLLATAEAR